eukprot:scaffold163939_cov26-Tisochrysis_lutea.AAC.1
MAPAPRWARIIDGDDEGLYAWAAANYVSGALEHSRSLLWVPEHIDGLRMIEAKRECRGVS